MKLNEIKIGLHRYPVVFLPDREMDGNIGNFSVRMGRIELNEELKDRPTLLFSCLLHEILHGVRWHFFREISEEEVEAICEPLAATLVESGLIRVDDLL